MQSTVQVVEFTCLIIVLPDCGQDRRKERIKRFSENNAENDNGNSEIVAYHKVKCVFMSLIDMGLQDAGQFLICEFKGYNFEIVSN